MPVEKRSVLIVGQGGREHALAWLLKKQGRTSRIMVAPGNAGIGQIAETFAVSATDLDAQVDLAIRERPDLVVVAPDDPLALGLVDKLQSAGIRAWGPTARAARIESSKAYSKQLMADAGVPTAAFQVFSNADKAKDYIRNAGHRVVVKASGLAAGKGAIVPDDVAGALDAIDQIMVKREFGSAGDQVVVEEFMEGEEASLFAICDGKNFHTFKPAQDHKPVFDGDKGPNTGGMGSYAPAPVMTADLVEEAKEQIIQLTLNALAEDNSTYHGILYVGLMITRDGLKVVEMNSRWGDPEAQVILPLLNTDLIEIMDASIDGTLDRIEIQEKDQAAVIVMLASGGYPGDYEKGFAIHGLADAENHDGVIVFHSGTAWNGSDIVTNGGRVAGVTAIGDDISGAVEHAYLAVNDIRFERMHFRRDIGHHALKRFQ